MSVEVLDPVLADGVVDELAVPEHFGTVSKLSKDLKKAACMLSQRQARWLVSEYYRIQKMRIMSGNQNRAAEKASSPSLCLSFMLDQHEVLERNVQKILGLWAEQWTVGRWLQSQMGIGPVISAGLLAHIDIRLCKTVGHIWRFAGLDPTLVWKKGEKRPWNAELKCLAVFKAGECFVKTSGRDEGFYGKLYRQRKEREQSRNASGGNAESAKLILSSKNWGKETVARAKYESGELPDAQLHARARRYAVKIFLSHLHEVMYRDYFGEAPPAPYVFAKSNEDHRHFIAPPMWPVEKPGRSLTEMYPPLPPINERQ
jgi:hypothetical protein